MPGFVCMHSYYTSHREVNLPLSFKLMTTCLPDFPDTVSANVEVRTMHWLKVCKISAYTRWFQPPCFSQVSVFGEETLYSSPSLSLSLSIMNHAFVVMVLIEWSHPFLKLEGIWMLKNSWVYLLIETQICLLMDCLWYLTQMGGGLFEVNVGCLLSYDFIFNTLCLCVWIGPCTGTWWLCFSWSIYICLRIDEV